MRSTSSEMISLRSKASRAKTQQSSGMTSCRESSLKSSYRASLIAQCSSAVSPAVLSFFVARSTLVPPDLKNKIMRIFGVGFRSLERITGVTSQLSRIELEKCTCYCSTQLRPSFIVTRRCSRQISISSCSCEPSIVMPRHCYAAKRRKRCVRPLRM